MRANAMKKIDHVEVFAEMPAKAPAKLYLLQLAREAEDAHDLPGNTTSPDFEEFLNQYGMSAFA